MSEIWFTSDLHFGHLKAAQARGFPTTEEHDEYIIDHFNQDITKHDKLYILGDVSLSRGGIRNLERLNGHKTIVLGNHDKDNAHAFMTYPNIKVEGAVSKSFEGFRTIMTHIPIHPAEFYRWDLNIHGHLHEKVIMDKAGLQDLRYFNVSPERWWNSPVHLHSILLRCRSMGEESI